MSQTDRSPPAVVSSKRFSPSLRSTLFASVLVALASACAANGGAESHDAVAETSESITLGPGIGLPGGGPVVGPPVGSPAPGPCQSAPPINPNRCNPEEPAPPPPVPPDGTCEIDIMAEWFEYEEGQGASEGKAEGSVSYTLTDSKSGDVLTTRIPETGSYKLTKDAEFTLNKTLGTYSVKRNRQLSVEVCATFREHDKDVIDINGDDDVGTDCETLTLTCPQAGDSELLHADLCRGGDCKKLKGAMASSIKVLAADADSDCVENEDDYTPEPCDEAWKGQLCRSSLVYFHYGNDAFTNLVQNLGTDLDLAMVGYDRVVLLIDDDQIGPFNLNPAALNLADVVMPPTEQNFFASLQDLTAEGCDIDVTLFSHGGIEWMSLSDLSVSNGGAYISALSDDDGSVDPDITTNELLADTDPAYSGTLAVPVRMTYGVPCFYAEWNQTWLDVGAKVTNGSVDVNFQPRFYGRFANAWNAGQTYGNALGGEFSVAEETLAFAFIEAQGLLTPWLCVGNSVLGSNACAVNFFTDTDLLPMVDVNSVLLDGPDEAKYALGGPLEDLAGIVYNPALSGVANMRASSTKVLAGNPAVRKNVPATLSWP
jgi:hypothetical protein